ncbi:MAG: SDR family oxidoreductase [Labilithrix sp.]
MSAKSVFVTGAARGLGKAIADALEQRGDRVGRGTRESADVTDFSAVEKALTDFAAGGLDAVIVNAAIAPAGLLATADPAELRRVVETNVLGPLHCARAALPSMMAQRRGLILFIGSVAASRPARGQAAYATSKSGVETLTRSIAVEYGRKGIRAICVRPGAIDTDLLRTTRSLAEREILERIPMKRIAPADEIARAVLMFLGDDASYVNGAVIDIDGGYAAG